MKNKPTIFKTPLDEVSEFFKDLGYEVDWDFKHGGNSWWEIGSSGKIICQIDMNVPLAHIIEDMTCWAEGRPTTSPSDWELRGPNSKRLSYLLQAVRRAGEITK